MNFELKVKEILKETYILTGKINDQNVINNLIYFIKNNKNNELNYKTNVKGIFTGFISLIEDENFHKFLNIIRPNINIIFQNDFIITDAWGNLCKFNEEVSEHDHRSTTAFCGILYLTEGGPGTYFKEYDLTINEEIGKYILFHPDLLHSVSKITNNIERMTVAFNMNRMISWENLNDYNLKIIKK